MKSRIKRLLYKTGILHTLHSLRNKDSLTVVMFHDVITGGEWLSDSSTWEIKQENFEQCLDVFEKLYHIISLEEFLLFMNGQTNRLPRRSLLITFDDGLRGQAGIAAQVLRSRGLPAHFFVTVGHLAPEENRPYRVKLENSRLLSEKEIKDLAAQGFSVGCHGLTHTPMTEIENENDLKAELLLPLEILKGIIPKNVGLQTLSFPHSKYDDKIMKYAFETGYKAIFGGGTRLNRISTLKSIKTINRVPIIERMWVESRDSHPSHIFQVGNLAWWLTTLKTM